MKFPLDSHVVVWGYGRSGRLPQKIRSAVENTSFEVFVSAVTFWEIAIKLRSKRLDVGGKTAIDLIAAARTMDLQIIALDAEEAASHQRLTEDTHFDPFDRMLIWQAISRDLTLI